MKIAAYVASPPGKTLLIYDGDCNFCKFWVVRGRQWVGERLDCIPFQDPSVPQRFPELSRDQMAKAVHLVEPDGQAYCGAEAVFRGLAVNRWFHWVLWLYYRVPGIAPVTEWTYALVAGHREIFSFITRLLWGRDCALPTYALVQWGFLRLLGLIYLSAFLSLGVQVNGLIGHNGILPAGESMESARQQFDQDGVGISRYFQLPTLCWLGASDGFLHSLCGLGAFFSLLIIFNLAPALCLFLCWMIYLSLASVSGVFLEFQWDSLLLETGLAAIFFAPWKLLPRFSKGSPSRMGLWLLRWLLFRLMLESGLIKIFSGDAAWHKLTALNFHYETQPLPTWLGWYAHQLPGGFQKFCVAAMFVIELGGAALIFLPRRLRFIGFALLVLLQICIMGTGNYCFFNWLTLALCLTLLDDAALLWWVPKKWWEKFQRNPHPGPLPVHSSPGEGEVISTKVSKSALWMPRLFKWISVPVAILLLVATGGQMAVFLRIVNPGPALAVAEWMAPLRSANHYGLFAVMTTTRPEIIIEGSDDGQTWRAYEFKYKPGDLKRRPGFVAPHQPRLDWQMWFAALGEYRGNPWLMSFCTRLLRGTPEVLALLEHNPFPGHPPKYIRAQLYNYHFSNLAERKKDGVWWRREFQGDYLPVVSLRR